MASSPAIDTLVEPNEDQALRRVLLPNIPTPPKYRKIGLHLSIVSQNALLGECLCIGLRTKDPDLTISLHDTVASLLSISSTNCDDLILVCLDAREFDQVGKNENDNINRLRKAGLSTRFLISSTTDYPTNASIALESGANGYIPPSTNLAVLSQVLYLAQVGGVFVPASSLQQMSTQATVEGSPSTQDSNALSPRQLLVAKALRKGTPNKVIAYDLNMCESTVKVHVRHIMKKLKAKNRTQVAFLTNSMFSEET